MTTLTSQTGQGPQNRPFEAVIQLPNGRQTKVRVFARFHHEAAEQINAMYGGGLIEGPWCYHNSDMGY